jgi:pimeloyl-ACP methyl ester carboxylesterase
MQPLFEYRTEFAGFQTRALELEGQGLPILLVHGFADSADTWRLTLDRLGRRDRCALAVDLPGFATASRLHRGPVLEQLDAFAAAAILQVAEEHGSDVIVAGNSLGGVVALRAAQRDDLPIAGIVPVAPAGLDMPRWLGLIERDPFIRTVLGSPVPLPEPAVRAIVGLAYRQLGFARPWAVPGEVVRSFTTHHRDRRALASYLEIGRRLLIELRDPFRLERVRCPVLLVWGDRDRMVFHHGAARVLDRIPHTSYELIAGCGHCPQVEEPDRFVDMLLRFADEHAPRGRRAA